MPPFLFMHRTARRLQHAGIGLVLAWGLAGVSEAASVAPVAAEHGMVVTAQHLATRVGVDVLRAGGNAVDAAVAVGYALAVVYPAAGNLGGGGFMTLRLADGRQTFIDFRETAPLSATPTMYQDTQGQVIPGLSTLGHRAAGVPGSVAGLELARQRYGTLPRARLVQPAIRLAERGFELTQGDVDILTPSRALLARDPAAARIFLRPDGQAPVAGDRLVQPDLARTLRAIRDRGADGFYRGPVAQRLLAANQAGGGLWTADDLQAYRALERPPIECDYRGYRVISAPPPSSGGVVLCQMLRVLEGYPLQEWGWRAARAVHVQIEAMRHAYAARNLALGDPDFVHNPVAELLGDEAVHRIRAAADKGRAGDSRALRPGEPGREGSNTTHYSIIDRWGNAVAVTTTLNDWFGAKVVAAGTGVLLNNEMDDFSVKPGTANLYGLVQGEKNAIAPAKRPLSSMSPTVVTRNGQPVLVLGTPGGSRIITAVLHTLIHVIDHGMTVQEAVDAPRFHHQWLPETTQLEPRALSPDTRALLEAMGHRFAAAQPANHVAAILVGGPALGTAPVGRLRYFGANDPRRNTGLALGY
jgi:gamma-glutamyltranspeptidase / glutathione hydrolase